MMDRRTLSCLRTGLIAFACLSLATAGLRGATSADEGLRQAFEQATGAREDGGAWNPLLVAPVWSQQQVLTAADGSGADRFGVSVSLSGDTAVIGASYKNGWAGAAYVFTRSSGVWYQQQELTASDGEMMDQFGIVVSVSGDTIVIGACNKTVNSNGTQGAAYVFTRSGGGWSQQQELTALDGAATDVFGYSVSVSGNTAVIGAPGHNQSSGAAYVFVLSGGTWVQQQELSGSDGAPGDEFGFSVSLSGGTVAIGAPRKNNLVGATYVFASGGGVWIQQQELTASDGVAYDTFGEALSLSGDTVVVGVQSKTINSNNLQGAAYVFARSGGVWSQQQELTAPDGAAVDGFGMSVSVYGDTVVVGAPDKSAYQGAAYAFARTAGTWGQPQAINAARLEAGQFYGSAVSLSGNTIMIGADGLGNLPGGAFAFVSPLQAQTIAFAALPNHPLSAAPFTIGATASSGLPVSFNSQTPAVCSVSGTVVTLIAAGTCMIQATQAGNASYAAATPITQSFQVVAKTQTIAFAALPNEPLSAPPFTVVATASSNLPVSFSSQTPTVCTVSGSLVTLLTAGTCTIQARQAGDADFAAATPVNQSFQVAAETQTIAFGTLANHVLGDVPFAIAATASSGLTVSFNSQTPSVCTVNGSLVTVVAVGTCTIQATQAGDATYAAAASVSRSFTITAVPLPAVTGVISAGAFGAFSAIAPGTWIEIYGSNLAASTRTWTGADFTGNTAPTSLGGVQVTVGGQPAFIDYVSPTQVDAQVSSSIAPGTWQLAVSSAGLSSTPLNVTVKTTAPGLLAPPSFSIGGNQYVVAQLPDGNYVLPTGAVAGLASRPARPGEAIVIYGIGFGQVVPNTPAGQIAPGSSRFLGPFEISFGPTPAELQYAGLAPGLVGLYQFNVVVPQVADSALVPLTFTLGGVAGTQTLYIAVHQ